MWNAEYRISLTRNLDISVGMERSKHFKSKRQEEEQSEEVVIGGGGDGDEDLERIRPQVFADLSPEAMNYIHKLQSELSNVKEVRLC